MGRFPKLLALSVILVFTSSGQAQLGIPDQARIIGEDDPCAIELGVASPSDNLSCEIVAPGGGTRCYNRTELCNGDLSAPGITPFNRVCFTGSDEGANIAALDCKFACKLNVALSNSIPLWDILE